MIAGIDFELIRILLAASMLGVASFLDIRKREISDLVWIFFGIIALAVYILEFILGGKFDIVNTGVPMLIAIAISFGIYKSGLFGGADALAIMTLTIILPTFSGNLTQNDLLGHGVLLHSIVPLIVLSNAVILSLSQIGLNLIRNGMYEIKNPGRLFEGFEHESISRKIAALLLGHKTGAKLEYAFSIEQVQDGRRQFIFAPMNAETTEYERRANIWVTTGIPFIVFMLTGFIVMLFVGDLVGFGLSTIKSPF